MTHPTHLLNRTQGGWAYEKSVRSGRFEEDVVVGHESVGRTTLMHIGEPSVWVRLIHNDEDHDIRSRTYFQLVWRDQ